MITFLVMIIELKTSLSLSLCCVGVFLLSIVSFLEGRGGGWEMKYSKFILLISERKHVAWIVKVTYGMFLLLLDKLLEAFELGGTDSTSI